MHSNFDFISFSGKADQGGGSEKVSGFFIDYSSDQIPNNWVQNFSEKMKNPENFEKSYFFDFLLFFNQIYGKKNLKSNKYDS